MTRNNAAIAEAYYTAWGKKNIADMEKFLHPDVRVKGPLDETIGKAAVIEALKKFASIFKSLTIRSKFQSENQAMLAIDMDFPAPIGTLRTASLLTFQDGLIVNVELFFDTRSFGTKG